MFADESIPAGRGFVREYHYFLLNVVILLIFTLERDLHWKGTKALTGGAKGAAGRNFPHSFRVKKCPALMSTKI